MNPAKAYRFVYFRIWLYQRDKFGSNSAAFNTVSALALLAMGNLAAIDLWSEVAFGFTVTRLSDFPIAAYLVAVGILMAILYLALGMSGPTKRVISEFASSDWNQQPLMRAIPWLYVIVTILAFLGGAVALHGWN